MNISSIYILKNTILLSEQNFYRIIFQKNKTKFNEIPIKIDT